MALTATFAADFTSFLDACAKAEVALKGIDTGAANVSTRLDKLSNSLTGRAVIQQATLMAEAVERVGGVSTLTANELQRVGAVAQEAAAKLRALGQDVPPGIQKIADAAKAAGTSTASLVDNLKAAIPTTSSLLTQIQATAVGYVTGALALQGFEKAGRAVVSFALDSVRAFQESEDSQRKLTTAMLAQGTASSANCRREGGAECRFRTA